MCSRCLLSPLVAAPIEIVEPSVLEASNIFAGSFVGAPLSWAAAIGKYIP